MPKVYLVGAGPGDPQLLTVKAFKLLSRARVVLYDRLVSEAILEIVPPSALLVPVGKEPGGEGTSQEKILELTHRLAVLYGEVVRLKGGDPMVFGRGAEEWLYLLERGIDVELVPGISSAFAVPALAMIPLTFRGIARSFTVVTGHCERGKQQDWRRFKDVDTLIILMGVANRSTIAAELIAAGRSPLEPVAFVEKGTTPQERVLVTTLGEVASGNVHVEPPAVFVVGEVVKFREILLEAARSISAASVAA